VNTLPSGTSGNDFLLAFWSSDIPVYVWTTGLLLWFLELRTFHYHLELLLPALRNGLHHGHCARCLRYPADGWIRTWFGDYRLGVAFRILRALFGRFGFVPRGPVGSSQAVLPLPPCLLRAASLPTRAEHAWAHVILAFYGASSVVCPWITVPGSPLPLVLPQLRVSHVIQRLFWNCEFLRFGGRAAHRCSRLTTRCSLILLGN